jgi:hypothetical protein
VKTRVLVAAALLLSFFPFMAVPVGDGNALQASFILSAALLLRTWRRPPLRVAWTVYALLASTYPLALLGMLVVRPEADALLALRATLALAIALVAVLLGGMVRMYLRPTTVMRCIGAAAAVHGFVAAVQVVSFRRGVFPFEWLYRFNPSMSRVTTVASDYAVYVRRPFAWFAEPSALGAALGVALLWTLWALRSRLIPAASASVITALLAWLLVIGRSRAIVPLVACAAWTMLARTRRRSRRRLPSVVRRTSTFVMFVPVAAVAVDALRRRVRDASLVADMGRADLLSAAFSVVLDGSVWDVIVGVGPAQIRDRLIEAVGEFSGVPSALLTLVVEAGLFAVVALIAVAVVMVRQSPRGDPSCWAIPVYAALALAVVTSYIDTMTPWVFLGWYVAGGPSSMKLNPDPADGVTATHGGGGVAQTGSISSLAAR